MNRYKKELRKKVSALNIDRRQLPLKYIKYVSAYCLAGRPVVEYTTNYNTSYFMMMNSGIVMYISKDKYHNLVDKDLKVNNRYYHNIDCTYHKKYLEFKLAVRRFNKTHSNFLEPDKTKY